MATILLHKFTSLFHNPATILIQSSTELFVDYSIHSCQINNQYYFLALLVTKIQLPFTRMIV